MFLFYIMAQGCVFFPTIPHKLKLMGVKSISASGVKQLVLISLQGFTQALAQTLIYPLLKFSVLEKKSSKLSNTHSFLLQI